MSIADTLTNANGSIALYQRRAEMQAKGTIICLHGGPGGDHHGNLNIFDEVAGVCEPLGYDILQFDMFGAGRSDGSAAGISLASQIEDYRSVMKFARSHLPGPLHVIGESMGATIAALDWQNDVATYVLLWPAFDLRDTDLRPYLNNEWIAEAHKTGYIEDNGVVIGANFLDELLSVDFTPCFNLPSAPCLLVHGKNDRAVPFRQSMVATERALGSVVLFAHPSGDHGLQKSEEREFTSNAYRWWFSR